MRNSQKSFSKIPLVDYVPAELRTNKDWMIVYYVLNPFTNKLVRKRFRVKPMKSSTERKRYAKKMVVALNSKLERGWNPFYENESAKTFLLLKDVTIQYVKTLEKKVTDKALRPDSLRSNKSHINMLTDYLTDNGKANVRCIDFTSGMIQGFLDYIYYDRNNSARTHNNYLIGMKVFCKYLTEREYINTDPTAKITSKRKEQKKREMIPFNVRTEIYNHLKEYNNEYLTLCLSTYFCFIRSTELTKIKVRDVNLKKGYILINGENAKNHKTEPVTIPAEYLPILEAHIGDAPANNYLFSGDGFKTGAEILKPRKITYEWTKMRNALEFSTAYQFYSLKDSGITELLNSGVAAIKVRDQARHHDLKITEAYTARNTGADETIKNINFNF
jgi:integrase